MTTLHVSLDGLAHCRECNTVYFSCPTCGGGLYAPALPPGAFRARGCPDCPDYLPGITTSITVKCVGYRANPTGEGPAPQVLSDDLNRLNRALARPAAARPRQPAAKRTVRPPRPPAPVVERKRVSEWRAEGAIAPSFDGAVIAAGYRRHFGKEPPRDPERRQTCAYSQEELAGALRALGYRGNSRSRGRWWP